MIHEKYHFDNVVNRRNLNSYKWDVGEDELPMWVADMDFDTAPEIKCAIQTRLNQGALGYNTVPDSFLSLIFHGGSVDMVSRFKKSG